MAATTPARLFCTLAGATLVIAGLIGFFYSAGFDTGVRQVRRDTEELFGLFAVNGWDNLIFIATGAGALVAAWNTTISRTVSLAGGLVLVILGLWGLLLDDDGVLLDLVPINDADSILYLLAGLAGLGAGAATPPSAPRERKERKPRERKPRQPRRRPERKPKGPETPARKDSEKAGGDRPTREERAAAREARRTRRREGDSESS